MGLTDTRALTLSLTNNRLQRDSELAPGIDQTSSNYRKNTNQCNDQRERERLFGAGEGGRPIGNSQRDFPMIENISNRDKHEALGMLAPVIIEAFLMSPESQVISFRALNRK